MSDDDEFGAAGDAIDGPPAKLIDRLIQEEHDRLRAENPDHLWSMHEIAEAVLPRVVAYDTTAVLRMAIQQRLRSFDNRESKRALPPEQLPLPGAFPAPEGILRLGAGERVDKPDAQLAHVTKNVQQKSNHASDANAALKRVVDELTTFTPYLQTLGETMSSAHARYVADHPELYPESDDLTGTDDD